MPGEPFSALTPSPTEFMSRSSIASGSRRATYAAIAPGKGLEFWGGSFLADPFGRVIAEATHDKEEILIGEVNLKPMEEIRRNWPFLRDRRMDAYAPITQTVHDRKTCGRNRKNRSSRKLPPRSAIACRPNGSRTRRPGSRGRTTLRLAGQVRDRSRGSTPRSFAISLALSA